MYCQWKTPAYHHDLEVHKITIYAPDLIQIRRNKRAIGIGNDVLRKTFHSCQPHPALPLIVFNWTCVILSYDAKRYKVTQNDAILCNLRWLNKPNFCFVFLSYFDLSNPTRYLDSLQIPFNYNFPSRSNLMAISPLFYAQLLCVQIPKA